MRPPPAGVLNDSATGPPRHTGPMPGMPRSHYVELAPPADLAPYVRHLWVQVIGEGDGTYDQPVLPDGSIDLIASPTRAGRGRPVHRGLHRAPAPGAWSVGAQFHPGAAPPLLGPGPTTCATAAWRRRTCGAGRAGCSATGRWRPTGATPAWRCWSRPCATGPSTHPRSTRPSPAACAPCAGGRARRCRCWPTPPGSASASCGGGSRPPSATRRGCWPGSCGSSSSSTRPGPAGPGGHDLAGLAATAGYADQAHLTRESRRLAGLPPAALLAWEAERLAAGQLTRRPQALRPVSPAWTSRPPSSSSSTPAPAPAPRPSRCRRPTAAARRRRGRWPPPTLAGPRRTAWPAGR